MGLPPAGPERGEERLAIPPGRGKGLRGSPLEKEKSQYCYNTIQLYLVALPLGYEIPLGGLEMIDAHDLPGNDIC